MKDVGIYEHETMLVAGLLRRDEPNTEKGLIYTGTLEARNSKQGSTRSENMETHDIAARNNSAIQSRDQGRRAFTGLMCMAKARRTQAMCPCWPSCRVPSGANSRPSLRTLPIRLLKFRSHSHICSQEDNGHEGHHRWRL